MIILNELELIGCMCIDGLIYRYNGSCLHIFHEMPVNIGWIFCSLSYPACLHVPYPVVFWWWILVINFYY